MNPDSTQPMPEKRSYTYSGGLLILFLLCGGILFGLVLIAASIFIFKKIEWGGILVGAFWTGLLIFTARGTFIKQRPIAIDETGITALFFGKTWKFIAWPEVTRIEQIRIMMARELGGWRNGYELAIVGPHDEINLEDVISDFPVLLNTLNFYVQRHQIPLLARDKGSDTIDRIRATVKDKQERKKLLKEGVQSSITALDGLLQGD